MNKDRFFKSLRKQLRALKPAELQRNISYYEEIISDMLENGLSEKEVFDKIGSPIQIAHEILESTGPENIRRKDIPGRILLAICALLLILAGIRARIQADSVAASVSIIGGADGPTSIFIAGKTSGISLIYLAAGAAVLITVIYYLIRRKRE